MYKDTIIALLAYIKSVVPNLEVFDAIHSFKEPDNYASLYILNITPTTPHEHFTSTSIKDADTKNFHYKETDYINIRVDFRGVNCYENMASFKSSFLKEIQRELLKEAGFGYLGLSAINPITSLRDSRTKQGMTTTLKLIGSSLVTDESQIIKDFNINVSIEPTLN